jgi:hypothetical protein
MKTINNTLFDKMRKSTIIIIVIVISFLQIGKSQNVNNSNNSNQNKNFVSDTIIKQEIIQISPFNVSIAKDEQKKIVSEIKIAPAANIQKIEKTKDDLTVIEQSGNSDTEIINVIISQPVITVKDEKIKPENNDNNSK